MMNIFVFAKCFCLSLDCVLKEPDKATRYEGQDTCRKRNHYCKLPQRLVHSGHLDLSACKCALQHICSYYLYYIKLNGLVFLQICAEERTDNRVVEFETAARKLDKKVLATTTRLNQRSGIQLWFRR